MIVCWLALGTQVAWAGSGAEAVRYVVLDPIRLPNPMCYPPLQAPGCWRLCKRTFGVFEGAAWHRCSTHLRPAGRAHQVDQAARASHALLPPGQHCASQLGRERPRSSGQNSCSKSGQHRSSWPRQRLKRRLDGYHNGCSGNFGASLCALSHVHWWRGEGRQYQGRGAARTQR